MATAVFYFHNYLRKMLKKEHGAGPSFLYHFNRKASIKDIIESLGVPHPIVGKLTVNDTEVGFDYILRHKDIVEASPLTPPVNPLVSTPLRPAPLERISFVADVNVGKLAFHLRTLGFDCEYGSNTRDAELVERAHSQKRILLTRDTSLLKRKLVIHGYLVRAQNPTEQLIEVMCLYDLKSRIKPLSRCIPCNGILVPVNKEAILNRLEPLTRKHYESFHVCQQCDRIYWPGSHQEKIVAFIEKILKALRQKGTQGT